MILVYDFSQEMQFREYFHKNRFDRIRLSVVYFLFGAVCPTRRVGCTGWAASTVLPIQLGRFDH
jgi:hypothetical protein